MLSLLLALTCLAEVPPTFEALHEEGGCAYARSAPQADGFPVLRAECRWPDVPAVAVHALLGDWGRHEAIWSMVASSVVVEDREADALVVHVHTAPLMTDREILLRMWAEDVDGGRIYRWARAYPQPAPAEGRVGVERDDGMYAITADGQGVHLISTLHYDPGGVIPTSLVAWFQVLGMPRFLDELKLAALSVDDPAD